MKTKHKPKRVLLFVTATPSSEDKAMARQAGILLRDPRAYRTGDFVEACNAVAGDVPPAYRARYLVLSPDDLAEILRPFSPVELVDPNEADGQSDGQDLHGEAHTASGESPEPPTEPSVEPPPAQPQQPEPRVAESLAADDSKVTVDSLKAELDAKVIPYPKTAKKAELQALLDAAA